MTEFPCRYVQGNQIDQLAGIEKLRELQVLNISNNELTSLEGINSLPKLSSLICASNKLQGIDALSGLSTCKWLSTLDVQQNKLDSEEVSYNTRMELAYCEASMPCSHSELTRGSHFASFGSCLLKKAVSCTMHD